MPKILRFRNTINIIIIIVIIKLSAEGTLRLNSARLIALQIRLKAANFVNPQSHRRTPALRVNLTVSEQRLQQPLKCASTGEYIPQQNVNICLIVSSIEAAGVSRLTSRAIRHEIQSAFP